MRRSGCEPRGATRPQVVKLAPRGRPHRTTRNLSQWLVNPQKQAPANFSACDITIAQTPSQRRRQPAIRFRARRRTRCF